MRMRIRQTGVPGFADLNASIDGKYYTNPFGGAPYYGLRVGRWDDDLAWEFEQIHHKVYLSHHTMPDYIQQFNISHGYNLFFVNRAVQAPWGIWRLGIGPVVAHPESKVHGLVNPKNATGGYEFAGACAQAGLEERWHVTSRLYLSAAGAFTAAWAHVDIAKGTADVPNVALHGLAGFGGSF